MTQQKSNLLAALYSREMLIAAAAVVAIAVHLVLRFGVGTTAAPWRVPAHDVPLLLAIACGAPLVLRLAVKLARGEFSSDLLAGISIVTSLVLGVYLAGTLVVLMLSGGQALEE